MSDFTNPCEILTKDLNEIIEEINRPDFQGTDLPSLISDFEEILTVLRALETLKIYMEK